MKARSLLLFFCLSFFAQGQVLVRKKGVPTVDGQDLNSIAMHSRRSVDFYDWRLGIHGEMALLTEINKPDFEAEEMLLVPVRLSVGRRLGGSNWFAKGSAGTAQDWFDGTYSGLIGASVRWDALDWDFFLFQRTVGYELALDRYFGTTNFWMPNLNAVMSARVGELVLIDITGGFGYCQPLSFENTALVIKFGMGINFGGSL